MIIDLFGVHTLSEELISLYEHYSGARPLLKLPATLKNQAYVSELQNLEYSAEVIERELRRLNDYRGCLAATKQSFRFAEYRAPGKGLEMILPLDLHEETDAYLLLACYASAIAEWMDVDKVPIRIGTPGRGYRQFNCNYLRLITKGNDHMALVVEPGNRPLCELREQVRELLEETRRDSVNCDKVISLWNEGRPGELAGIFSFGPLGRFTATASSDRTIRSVPRPLWGIRSFGLGGGGGDLKVGLFTFRDEGSTRIHLHAKGVAPAPFAELCELVTSKCKLSGFAKLSTRHGATS